jgi:hypothetical protein
VASSNLPLSKGIASVLPTWKRTRASNPMRCAKCAAITLNSGAKSISVIRQPKHAESQGPVHQAQWRYRAGDRSVARQRAKPCPASHRSSADRRAIGERLGCYTLLLLTTDLTPNCVPMRANGAHCEDICPRDRTSWRSPEPPNASGHTPQAVFKPAGASARTPAPGGLAGPRAA